MGSYTISSRFNSLEGFNTQFIRMNFSQSSSIIAQIQIKARMNHKGALKDMQMGFNAQRKEKRAFKARTSG